MDGTVETLDTTKYFQVQVLLKQLHFAQWGTQPSSFMPTDYSCFNILLEVLIGNQ